MFAHTLLEEKETEKTLYRAANTWETFTVASRDSAQKPHPKLNHYTTKQHALLQTQVAFKSCLSSNEMQEHGWKGGFCFVPHPLAYRVFSIWLYTRHWLLFSFCIENKIKSHYQVHRHQISLSEQDTNGPSPWSQSLLSALQFSVLKIWSSSRRQPPSGFWRDAFTKRHGSSYPKINTGNWFTNAGLLGSRFKKQNKI